MDENLSSGWKDEPEFLSRLSRQLMALRPRAIAAGNAVLVALTDRVCSTRDSAGLEATRDLYIAEGLVGDADDPFWARDWDIDIPVC